MQRVHLMDEFYQVLQQSRKFCTNPKGALETKDNISPFCLSCLPVRSTLKGSFVQNPTQC